MHDELSAGGVADQPQRGVDAWCERPAELEAHQLGDGVVGTIGWRRLVAEAAVALVAAAEPAKALRPLVGVDLNAARRSKIRRQHAGSSTRHGRAYAARLHPRMLQAACCTPFAGQERSDRAGLATKAGGAGPTVGTLPCKVDQAGAGCANASLCVERTVAAAALGRAFASTCLTSASSANCPL